MKTSFRKLALALAASAAMTSAHAGVLTWQDVVFTTNWANNVLTLEIDAGQHSGDWTGATMLGALSIKDIGTFRSVTVSAAPQGADAWKMSARELNAKGCAGGGGSRGNTSLCLAGAPIALTDNMVFTFAFTGAPDLAEPHLKVSFLDSSKNKVGDLLSQTITASTVAAPAPVTPTPVPPAAPTPVEPSAVPVVPTPTPTPTPTPVVPTPETAPPVTTLPTPATEPVVVLEPVAQDAVTEVPEPRTFALMLAGLVLMGAALRKRG